METFNFVITVIIWHTVGDWAKNTQSPMICHSNGSCILALIPTYHYIEYTLKYSTTEYIIGKTWESITRERVYNCVGSTRENVTSGKFSSIWLTIQVQ